MFKHSRFTNLIAVNIGAGPELHIVPAAVWLRECHLKFSWHFRALVNVSNCTKNMLQERNNPARKLKTWLKKPHTRRG